MNGRAYQCRERWKDSWSLRQRIGTGSCAIGGSPARNWQIHTASGSNAGVPVLKVSKKVDTAVHACLDIWTSSQVRTLSIKPHQIIDRMLIKSLTDWMCPLLTQAQGEVGWQQWIKHDYRKWLATTTIYMIRQCALRSTSQVEWAHE